MVEMRIVLKKEKNISEERIQAERNSMTIQ